MKFCKLLVLVSILLTISCASINFIESDGVFFKGITLYNDLRTDIQYVGIDKTSFNQSELGNLNWQIDFTSQGVSNDYKFPIKCIITTADSIIINTIDTNIIIPKDWIKSAHNYSFGWGKAGIWEPGTYTLSFYIRDELYHTRNFEVISEDFIGVDQLDLFITSLKFYESDVENLKDNERFHGERFCNSFTRYINWELNLMHQNNKYKRKFDLKAIYYGINGEILETYTRNCKISDDWAFSQFTSGWGYPKPNRWETGVYKVEIYIDNKLQIVEEFEIF